MAPVYLTTTAPHPEGAFEKLRALAPRDPFGVHTLADDPARADVILFLESWDTSPAQRALRRHPLVRRYREKSFAQSDLDLVIPFVPGVYPSIPRPFYRADRVRTGSYVVMYANEHVGPGPLPEKPHLFSFLGDAGTAPVRQAVLALDHPEALIEDTSAQAHRARWTGDADARRAFMGRYAEVLRESLFVLCPRGFSPSSVRIFEVMKTGRVPVILSDDWVPPEGPDWPSFALHVPEADVAQVPALLEQHRGRAAAMGAAARTAWEAWFADEVLFHRLAEACLAIARARARPEALLRHAVWRQVASPTSLRLLAHEERVALERRVRAFAGPH